VCPRILRSAVLVVVSKSRLKATLYIGVGTGGTQVGDMYPQLKVRGKGIKPCRHRPTSK